LNSFIAGLQNQGELARGALLSGGRIHALILAEAKIPGGAKVGEESLPDQGWQPAAIPAVCSCAVFGHGLGLDSSLGLGRPDGRVAHRLAIPLLAAPTPAFRVDDARATAAASGVVAHVVFLAFLDSDRLHVP
jgi:hypothetical protein